MFDIIVAQGSFKKMKRRLRCINCNEIKNAMLTNLCVILLQSIYFLNVCKLVHGTNKKKEERLYCMDRRRNAEFDAIEK